MKNILLFSVFIVFTFVNLSTAQFDNNKDNDKKQFRAQIDSIMKQKLIEKLNLSESSADKYIIAIRENNGKVKDLLKEKKTIMKSIEADPEAADVGSKLDKSFEIDSRIIETRKEFIRDVSSYMTPQQIAKSMILKKNFNKEFKNQIKKHKNKDKINKRNQKQK
ncbi:MAG: hypothetical protein IPG09_04135 [Ignavibacteria bacterium]|nr:hypothetical protein [Ignavibacteria bacterium]